MHKDKLKSQIHWWLAGFLTAFVFLLIIVMKMAQSVYSQLPKKAELNSQYHPVDVIVILTGGKGRLKSGFELFEKGYGKQLHISGLDRQVNLREVLKESKKDSVIDVNKITIDSASNTMENAKEVLAFVQLRNVKKILLVTSIYHVRRAYYIFRKIIPEDVVIDVSWHEQEPFDENDWWKRWNGIFVTLSEYFKFFGAYVELSNLR